MIPRRYCPSQISTRSTSCPLAFVPWSVLVIVVPSVLRLECSVPTAFLSRVFVNSAVCSSILFTMIVLPAGGHPQLRQSLDKNHTVPVSEDLILPMNTDSWRVGTKDRLVIAAGWNIIMLHHLQRYRVNREDGPLARIDARLLHPIVASERDFPMVLVTLPAGATIEYEFSTGVRRDHSISNGRNPMGRQSLCRTSPGFAQRLVDRRCCAARG